MTISAVTSVVSYHINFHPVASPGSWSPKEEILEKTLAKGHAYSLYALIFFSWKVAAYKKGTLGLQDTLLPPTFRDSWLYPCVIL